MSDVFLTPLAIIPRFRAADGELHVSARRYGVVERLERVEELLEKILERGVPDGEEFQINGNVSTAPARPSRRLVEDDLHGRNGHLGRGNTTTAVDALGTQARSNLRMPQECAESLPLHRSFVDICQTLHEALPSQEDSSFLFKTGRSSIFLQAICNPYNELFNERAIKPASTLAILPDVTRSDHSSKKASATCPPRTAARLFCGHNCPSPVAFSQRCYDKICGCRIQPRDMPRQVC
ncbi:hypothetical protein B0J14DRAFT_609781 [Halenospora varia]|nr:hypothetical protein B0J14DRAFT_609781 [Halenospora varia]